MPFDASETDPFAYAGWRAMLPAWLLSLAAHLLLAITGSWLVRAVSSDVEATEPIRAGEIVIARRDAGRTEYFTDEPSAGRHETLRPVDSAVTVSSAEATGGARAAADHPPLLAGIALPQLSGNLPVGEGLVAAPQLGVSRGRPRIPGNPLDEAAILAEDALIPREAVPTGPTAQLSLFGSAKAEGRSFVFVIDRSNSMGGDGLGAIQAAAKELAARLDQLTAEQTFQVVAYNQAVAYFTNRELLPATSENKRQLVHFVANLGAFGQTEHSRGLLAALRLKPEVIFLLTDGGDPVLDPGQLRTIREQAAGRTSIHCLHFGRGMSPTANESFVRLAQENRGSYTYIDVNAR
jgi:hypothetical protein